MTTSAGLLLWTKCFTRIGDNNRAIFEAFVRAAREENLAFLHRRMEQQRQFSERMHHDTAELLNAQQDFAKEAVSDCVDQAHKLGKLYWQNVENRVEETTDAVASILPFPPEAATPGNRRKAA